MTALTWLQPKYCHQLLKSCWRELETFPYYFARLKSKRYWLYFFICSANLHSFLYKKRAFKLSATFTPCSLTLSFKNACKLAEKTREHGALETLIWLGNLQQFAERSFNAWKYCNSLPPCHCCWWLERSTPAPVWRTFVLFCLFIGRRWSLLHCQLKKSGKGPLGVPSLLQKGICNHYVKCSHIELQRKAAQPPRRNKNSS